jgi:hypothetical protein
LKRLLTTLALCALSACGGFENEPLTVGVVRGQLAGTVGEGAVVAVIGHEQLVTRPDAMGRFELRNVPIGPADLLIISSQEESRRLSITVGSASVVELGVLTPRPSARFEIYLSAEGGHRTSGGSVTLVGTPLVSSVQAMLDNEAEFFVPGGCYTAHVVVPGLGQTTVDGCVAEGGLFERRLAFGLPDGTEGQEGCSVTGCEDGLACQADRSCL